MLNSSKSTFLQIAVFFIGFLLFLNVAKAQQKIEKWSRFELVLNHPNPEESFSKVKISARFYNTDTCFVVPGFYDGNNQYKIRFMPNETGPWSYTTTCNIPALNNKKGIFECVEACGNNHGMVKVSNTYNFKYADDKQYYPFGTTAYAWTHMSQGIQEMTLNTLKNSGFNKVRMCVFPKNYDLVKEEPEIYPYLIKEIKKDTTGKEIKVWDFDRFNPLFFQHLEKRIDDLCKLGIEADLILFHPYDKGRWGFDAMSNDLNIRYINYVTARLSSFRNVWWSIANEWDLVKTKTNDDWDLLSKNVATSDPYRHLCSIHGSTAIYYEYWKPEFTHVSIQDEAPVMNWGAAALLRNAYYKPIIYDEVGYEGNLKSRWGRYSPEEMTYLVWMGVIAGTYVTHGESYMFKNNTDTIFWAKGGAFKGTSWRRIAFLRKIVEEGPGPLKLSDVSRDNRTSSAGNGYYIIYFGKEMNDSWLFNLPVKNSPWEKVKSGARFKVEVIDTWDMTIQTYPETFETTPENDYRVYDKDFKKVRLPLKPYIALRITQISNENSSKKSN
ncbi:MAG: DUF5605 domain-containing protein [Bacteroidia bacterium]|nr:DUF5605 domain-containing protein [Bacteroidia bacterium]